MPFDQRDHVIYEGAHRRDHQAPEPTVDPGSLAGALDALPVGKHLDDPRPADLRAIGPECRNAGVDFAVDGLHEDGRALRDLDLGFGLLSGDDEDLPDPQEVRVADPVGPHELVDRAVEALCDLPEGVARLHGDRPWPLVGQRLGTDLGEVHALVHRCPQVRKLGGRPPGDDEASDRGGRRRVAEEVQDGRGGRLGGLVGATAGRQ